MNKREGEQSRRTGERGLAFLPPSEKLDMRHVYHACRQRRETLQTRENNMADKHEKRINLSFYGQDAENLQRLANFKGLTVEGLVERALLVEAALTKEVYHGNLVVIADKNGKPLKEMSSSAI